MDDVDRTFLASAVYAAPREPSRPRTSWRPLRVYAPDRDLGTTVSHVYGYRADCSCGWRSDVVGTVADCRVEIRAHRAECHRSES